MTILYFHHRKEQEAEKRDCRLVVSTVLHLELHAPGEKPCSRDEERTELECEGEKTLQTRRLVRKIRRMEDGGRRAGRGIL